MKRKLLSAASAMLFTTALFAQTTEENKGQLQINGSLDLYYRYNFANAKKSRQFNSKTSFTNSQNSFELGMASIKTSYTKGKAGVVIDLGVGSRANEFSYNENGVLQAIKQAYLTYSPSENVKISAGKWGTHLGYELVDPQLNRNYSMSYMFTYGPFTHTGVKADFTFKNGFGLMAGIANPTDFLSASFAKKNLIAQFSKTSEKINAYLNYVGGKDTAGNGGNQLGLTATAKLSDVLSLGYDGTVKFIKPKVGDDAKWWASALYLNIDPSEKFGLTLRGEYFEDKKNVLPVGTSVFQSTLSLNIKPVKGLCIIPELRLDNAKDPIFTSSDGSASKNTGSFLVAAVYSF